jgi:hypothetical protein
VVRMVLVGLVVTVIRSLPDIARYLKIRRM